MVSLSRHRGEVDLGKENDSKGGIVMKKAVVAGMLVVSALTFAANGSSTPMDGQRRAGIETQLAGLTDAQKEELTTMREVHRRENQELRLNMRETDLKMERELLKEKPNRLAINKLIDEKAKYRVAMEKNRMDFKLDAREKFGIDVGRHHNKNMGHMGSKKKHRNN